MAEITVTEYSKKIGITPDALVKQLSKAGIAKNAGDTISDEEKMQLLQHMRDSDSNDGVQKKKKITLQKRTARQRIKTTQGRSVNTVKIEIRKKKQYQDEELKEEQDLKEPQEKQEKAPQKSTEKTAPVIAPDKKKTDKPKKKQSEKKSKSYTNESSKKADKAKADRAIYREKKERSELHVHEANRGKRKARIKKKVTSVSTSDKHQFEMPTEPVVREIVIPNNITVSSLAQEMAVKSAEVIKSLMGMGVMATINQVLDQDTAILVVEEMGHAAKVAREENIESTLLPKADISGKKDSRAPVVTIMGHVDHGKTSLLDFIRKSRIASSEAGGITQHIGAYQVKTKHGKITFLDTPGHAAFTSMRARGANCTDIVILVVAADDGVMPQTEEAVMHAKAANVPIIVAVNKIDKENADSERVKTELSKLEVVPEDWGGETIFADVSAITGDGVDSLLEAISLQAELLELQAVIKGPASGYVIESSLDKGKGAVATVLIQNGTLQQGDIILCGKEYGRVRAMLDENGKKISEAGPSRAVSVLGLSGSPDAGDEMIIVDDERKAKEVASYREDQQKDAYFATQKTASLDTFFNEGDGIKTLNVFLKCDVQGSAQALRESLENLSTEEVHLKIINAGIGGINESDVVLANASNAIIMGFNVRADKAAKKLIADDEIDLRYYSVIYELIDDVRNAMSGLLAPELHESIIGLAEVKDIFKSSKMGAVAGCQVVEGLVKHGSPIRVLRDNIVIFEGELESLRRHKDDAKEVKAGTECGIAVKNYNDVKVGDNIEVFERKEVPRTL